MNHTIRNCNSSSPISGTSFSVLLFPTLWLTTLKNKKEGLILAHVFKSLKTCSLQAEREQQA
jgi:hypothetical protein